MECIQEDWQREQLRACLDDCMLDIDPEQAGIVSARYYKNKDFQTIADETGGDQKTVRLLEQKALRALRNPKHSLRLKSFPPESSCSGYGLEAYKNRGFVSKVEVLAGV